MQTLEHLTVLRRRWRYIALGLVVGVLAGFFTAPGISGAPEAYEATHTMLAGGEREAARSVNLEQAALLVESGAVPERVAVRLAEERLPAPRSIVGVANPNLGSLDITVESVNPAAAERAADLSAEELNAELVALARTTIQRQVDDAQARITQLAEQLTALQEQLVPLAPEDPLRADIEGQIVVTSSDLDDAREGVQVLEASLDVPAPLRTLEAATAAPAKAVGWQLPESKPARAAVLGLFGLLLGIAGAIAADRLDTRIRDKNDAEQAFDAPVIAEIPPLPNGVKRRELLVSTRPSAPFVEAYRALRTVVLFAATHGVEAHHATNGTGPNGSSAVAATPGERSAQVLILTSPSPGEGKTTSTAHLAAVLAEFGKRVLVISADFRRPRIHELFGVDRDPGLSDVLDAGSGRIRLSDLQMGTSFPGVHLLPSGSPVDNPAELLTETAQLIAAARSLFDFIVVDTPPLLVANDATELAAVADMVVLLAKADRTSRDAARRSTEILQRVGAPLLGVVVIAAHDTPTAYGYYRYRYYAEADQGVGRSRRRAKKEPALVEVPERQATPAALSRFREA